MSEFKDANIEKYSDGAEIDGYISNNYHDKRLQIALKLVDKYCSGKNLHSLDIGAGNNYFSTKLAEKGFHPTVIDLYEMQKNPSINYVVGDVEKRLPFKDEYFDLIFAGEIIEHIFDTRAFLLECVRVLKPCGKIIITTPNLATLQDRLRFLVGKSPRQINPLHRYLYLHIRPFTKNLIKSCFAETGIKYLCMKSNYVRLKNKRDKTIFQSRLLAKLFPSLGGSLIVVGEKNGTVVGNNRK